MPSCTGTGRSCLTLLPTFLGMQPLAVVTVIPPAGTKPASITDCLHAGAANMIEVTGIASTDNSLYLLRWYPDIGGGTWRPWKSDRPFVPDANGYFSGDIELPSPAGSEYFVMFSTQNDGVFITDCYGQATTYR